MSSGPFMTKQFPGMEPSIVGVLYLVIGITGVIGNLLTLLTFSKGKVLQSPKNVLQAHFALANIGVIIGFPFPGLSIIGGRWLFGDVGCQIYAFVGFFFGMTAIGFLLALAFEQYLTTACKDFYASLTTKHMNCIALLAWAQGFVWAVMPLLGWSRYAYEPTRTSCTIDWTANDPNHVSFISLLTGLGFVVPVLLAILFLLLAHSAVNASKPVTKLGDITETQLLKITSIIIVLSMVMWSPYAYNCITSILMGGDDNPSLFRAAIPALSAKGGTMLFAFIYPLLSQQYRSGMISFSTREVKTKEN